ncbi:Flagellar basal body-associated protein FliL [compost metagenome]
MSQRTSNELLQREGKEKLAADILREVSRPLGFSVPSERERARAAAATQADDADEEERPARKRTERNPVHRVLLSSFIIQ